jgi:hypothetical protein
MGDQDNKYYNGVDFGYSLVLMVRRVEYCDWQLFMNYTKGMGKDPFSGRR